LTSHELPPITLKPVYRAIEPATAEIVKLEDRSSIGMEKLCCVRSAGKNHRVKQIMEESAISFSVEQHSKARSTFDRLIVFGMVS
jgi:hypothetical protein